MKRRRVPLSARGAYNHRNGPYQNVWCLQYFPLIQRRQRNRHTCTHMMYMYCTVAHKYKPAAAQKTTARNRKQLHGTENSCTEQKAAARNRKLRHGTESCCTEQKIRLLRGINTRIPATRNTLSPTARNTLSPRADIAAARHRQLLRHGIEQL